MGIRAALAGAGVDNSRPDPELVGLPSADASVSSAPLIKALNPSKITSRPINNQAHNCLIPVIVATGILPL